MQTVFYCSVASLLLILCCDVSCTKIWVKGEMRKKNDMKKNIVIKQLLGEMCHFTVVVNVLVKFVHVWQFRAAAKLNQKVNVEPLT